MVNTEVCVLQMMPKNVGVIVLAMKISPKAWRVHHVNPQSALALRIRVTSLDVIRTMYESYRKVTEIGLPLNGRTNGLVTACMYMHMQKLSVYPFDSTTLGSGEAWPVSRLSTPVIWLLSLLITVILVSRTAIVVWSNVFWASPCYFDLFAVIRFLWWLCIRTGPDLLIFLLHTSWRFMWALFKL